MAWLKGSRAQQEPPGRAHCHQHSSAHAVTGPQPVPTSCFMSMNLGRGRCWRTKGRGGSSIPSSQVSTRWPSLPCAPGSPFPPTRPLGSPWWLLAVGRGEDPRVSRCVHSGRSPCESGLQPGKQTGSSLASLLAWGPEPQVDHDY